MARGTGKRRQRQLVDAARNGDTDAFVALVDGCRSRVASAVMAAGIAFDRESRQDAEQEAFLAIWRSFSTFRGDADLCTWMYRVARNVSSSRVLAPELRQRRITERVASLRVQTTGDSTEDAAADMDLAALIFSRLQEDHREVLRLHVVEELSYKQIARELNIAPGTVASRLNRAKREVLYLLREAER